MIAPSGKFCIAGGERESCAGAYQGASALEAGVNDSDRHALGYVVHSDGQDHHSSPREPAPRTLGLAYVPMEMRYDVIQKQQEEYPGPKASECRREGEPAHIRALLDRRDDEAPHGRSDHHSPCEACERPLDSQAELLFHEEHAGRARGGPDEGYQQAYEYSCAPVSGVHFLKNKPLFSSGTPLMEMKR